jgi:hypothetical protein
MHIVIGIHNATVNSADVLSGLDNYVTGDYHTEIATPRKLLRRTLNLLIHF